MHGGANKLSHSAKPLTQQVVHIMSNGNGKSFFQARRVAPQVDEMLKQDCIIHTLYNISYPSCI